MRIAVTGGAGYIGSVAVQRLTERGDTVIGHRQSGSGHAAAVAGAAAAGSSSISATGTSRPNVSARTRNRGCAPFRGPDDRAGVRERSGPYWRVNAYGTLQLLEAIASGGD